MQVCLFCHKERARSKKRSAPGGPVSGGSPKFQPGHSYNARMITFRAPSGASAALHHAVDLVNRDLDGLLDDLDTHQQYQFWSNLHQYALGHTEHKERQMHLIASADGVDAAAREALELADEKFAEHLETLSGMDRDRFWQMLHAVAEQQAEMTGHTKVRFGGDRQ